MKPVTRFFVTLAAIGLCLPVTAQVDDQSNVKYGTNTGLEAGATRGTATQTAGAATQNFLAMGEECGMYLCEDWKAGTLELQDGSAFTNRMFRYNLYHQQMEFAAEGDTAAIGNPEQIAKLTLDDKVFVYRKFFCNEQVREGYLELLVEGKYELLLHRGIKYVEENNPYGSETGGPVVKYYQDQRYFLSCDQGIAEQLPERKNAIIAAISEEDQQQLKQFVKEHKCKLKSQDELVSFFVFANGD